MFIVITTLSSLQDCNEAIERDPKEFAAWFNKGNALARLQDYAGALESYRTAADLAPGIAGYRSGLSHVVAGPAAGMTTYLYRVWHDTVAAVLHQELQGVIDEALAMQSVVLLWCLAQNTTSGNTSQSPYGVAGCKPLNQHHF